MGEEKTLALRDEWNMKLYEEKRIDWDNILFDNRTLFGLLLPIVIEQFLNSLMGMVDTMMVSTVGSEAISAVSLVDSINNLVIQVFAAMASGAKIICSQYIGRGGQAGGQPGSRAGCAHSVCHIDINHCVLYIGRRAAAGADIRGS